MVSPDARPAFHYVQRPLTHADLLAMRGKFAVSDNRRQVTDMAERAAGVVLGDLLPRALPNIVSGVGRRLGKNYSGIQFTGEMVIHHQYSQTLGSVAVVFGWGEEDPGTRILSARLHEYEVRENASTVSDQQRAAELYKLAEEMDTRITAYTTVNPVLPTIVDMELLIDYFSNKKRNTNLDNLLRQGRFTDFFAALRSRKAARDREAAANQDE